MGLINAWFSHAGSKHNLTLPLALGTNTKLLHHSYISLTPSGAIISCCCSLSNSSLNGFCSAYATCLGGAWYSLLSGFSCKENVPSKHPMPLNILFNSLCICCAHLALFLLYVSQPGPERKYFVGLFALVLTIDLVPFLVDFEMLSVFA